MTVNQAFEQWLQNHAIPCHKDGDMIMCMECGATPGDQHTLACKWKDKPLPSLDYLKGMADASVDRAAPIPKKSYAKKRKPMPKPKPPTLSDVEFEKIDLYAEKDEDGETQCRKCLDSPTKILTKGMETAWFCPVCGYIYRTTSDTRECGCCGKTKMQGCDCLNLKNQKTKGDPCEHCGEYTDKGIDCSECRIDEIKDETEANKKCHYCNRTDDGGCNCTEDDNQETNGDVCGACEELEESKNCDGCLHE